MSIKSEEAMWIDRTGWTWIAMRGADRTDLLNRLSTNDLTQLTAGKGLQTVLTTDKARIIDVLMVLNDKERSMVVASPGMGTTILQWLRKYTITDDVKPTDATSQVGMVEVTGSRAADVVRAVIDVDVTKFTIGEWIETPIGDADLYVFRMPATVEMSYWLVGSPSAVDAVKASLAAIEGLEEPLTEEDVEYLRVMRGVGAIGHEWSDAYNPLEAGLLHLTSFTKGCYIGQEIIARLESYNKVKQRIMGFSSDTELHVGDAILATDDGEVPSADKPASVASAIGALTTVTKGRTTNKWYAIGYIRGEHAHPGTSVGIRSSNTDVQASISDNQESNSRAVIHLLPMEER